MGEVRVLFTDYELYVLGQLVIGYRAGWDPADIWNDDNEDLAPDNKTMEQLHHKLDMHHTEVVREEWAGWEEELRDKDQKERDKRRRHGHAR